MNYFRLSYVRIVAVLLIVSAVAYSLVLRHRQEKMNRSVEICINWKETLDFTDHSKLRDPNLNLSSFLERCKIMGVSSIALEEETLEDYISRGKIIFFSQGEIEKLKSLGMGTDLGLTSNLFWIKKDMALYERMNRILNAISLNSEDLLVKKSPKRMGDYILMENPYGSWDRMKNLNLGFDPEQADLIQKSGFSIVYQMKDFDEFAVPKNVSIEPYGESISACFVDHFNSFSRSNRRLRIQPVVLEYLKSGRTPFILFENQNRILEMPPEFSGHEEINVVRGHAVSQEEMKTLKKEFAAARWIRAVHERSCRFLYFRWNAELNVEENFDLLRKVSQNLKRKGYRLEKLMVRNGNGFAFSFPLKKLRNFFALCFAVLGPILGIGMVKNYLDRFEFSVISVFLLWVMAFLTVLATGLAVTAMLPDKDYINGTAVFRGVKFSLIFPILFGGIVLYKTKDIVNFLRLNISIAGLIFFGIIVVAVKIFLDRSGNFSGSPSSYELHTRLFLENVLSARPRFKEFLLGHPFMIFGIFLYLSKNIAANKNNEEIPSELKTALMLIWFGMVGMVSIVNSFCHLHTPVTVSLLRTFHGFWIGGLIGFAMIGLYRLMQKYNSSRRSDVS